MASTISLQITSHLHLAFVLGCEWRHQQTIMEQRGLRLCLVVDASCRLVHKRLSCAVARVVPEWRLGHHWSTKTMWEETTQLGCIYDRESNLRICDRDEVRGVAASVCSAIASGYAAEGDCGWGMLKWCWLGLRVWVDCAIVWPCLGLCAAGLANWIWQWRSVLVEMASYDVGLWWRWLVCGGRRLGLWLLTMKADLIRVFLFWQWRSNKIYKRVESFLI